MIGEDLSTRPAPGWAIVACFLAVVVLLGSLCWFSVVGYVDGPIIGELDTGQYAFTGFYLGENITWLPWPQLKLETDWTQFPYGANHAFLHWAFERDLLFSILNERFGPGPWFQLYFVLSMAITAVGSFLLLKAEYDPRIAAIAGLSIGFCNFYAIKKFPAHMPHSIVHWTALGIVVDAIILRRVSRGDGLSPLLGLSRLALLVLSLGLELGYIAGFSLLSFTVTLVALTGHAVNGWRRSSRSMCALVVQSKATLAQHLKARPAASVAIVMVVMGATWLYVPLSAQIAMHATELESHDVIYRRWESPLRVFLPYLPGLNPEMIGREALGDRGENWGFHFSPGLSLTLFAAFGVWVGRRRWPAFAAPLIVFLLCLFFDPTRFPTLHMFPWFRYARVPGRATAVFPVLLVVLALAAWPLHRRKPWHVATIGLLLGLLVTETAVVYRVVATDRMSPSTVDLMRPDDHFWELMSAIRRAPGAAVLEWPFSISAGGKLGIFHGILMGTNQFAQFHHKKVIGVHFGRPNPENIVPLLEAGWPHLFLAPGRPSRSGHRGAGAARQRRDFVASEWDFFSDFYTTNDFCGILLYPDLLPPDTAAGFYARFGKPTADAEITPGPGRAQFIAKPSSLRRWVDPHVGKAIRLHRQVFPLPLSGRLDFGDYATEDLLGEQWSEPRSGARFAQSEGAEILFGVDPPVALALTMEILADGHQEVRIECNQAEIGVAEVSDRQLVRVVIPAEYVKKENTLRIIRTGAQAPEGRQSEAPGRFAVYWLESRRLDLQVHPWSDDHVAVLGPS